MNMLKQIPLLLLLVLLAGCATNPVTGRSEISLVSESTELDIGTKQYLPSRQMQGGDYKLDPELTRYVNKVGQRLAAVSDRKLPYEFVVLNSSVPNAWALPGGKIAINRGLLVELESEAELAAVLGHEIVHAAARHGAKGMERGMALNVGMVAAGIAVGDSDYAKLAVGAAAIGANLINQKYSRSAELESDRYGMVYMARAGYDPVAAVDLQKTFLRISKGRNENWLSGLFASHPPSRERVEKNQQSAQSMVEKGGRLGREAYREKIAYLRKTLPAYKSYDAGIKALQGSKPDLALQQAAKAIAIEPGEALFYSLKGDALTLKKQYRQAEKAYDRAVQMDPDFFRHSAQRGSLRFRRGDLRGARQDLKQSLKLLPTADVHYLLGRLEQKTGNSKLAYNHFKQASESRSRSGKAAAIELVQLDLPHNPGRYLKTGLKIDKDGVLLLLIKNASPVTIGDIELIIGQRERSGKLARGSRMNLRRPLQPGQQIAIKVADRMEYNSAELQRTAVRVAQARVIK